MYDLDDENPKPLSLASRVMPKADIIDHLTDKNFRKCLFLSVNKATDRAALKAIFNRHMADAAKSVRFIVISL